MKIEEEIIILCRCMVGRYDTEFRFAVSSLPTNQSVWRAFVFHGLKCQYHLAFVKNLNAKNPAIVYRENYVAIMSRIAARTTCRTNRTVRMYVDITHQNNR